MGQAILIKTHTMQKTVLRLASLFLVLLPSLAIGQQTMTFDASTSFILPEYEAIIVEEEGQLKVEFLMAPPSSTNDPLEDTIKKGDLILMMNGSRLTTIDEIRASYDGLSEGDEIKIGIRRGQERFILRKEKGNVPEHGGGRMVMSMDMQLEEGVDPVVVPELGLMLVETNDQIEILSSIPPLLPEELKSKEVEGYAIVSVNGENFESVDELKFYIEKLAEGDTIDLTMNKAGDEIAVSFAKQKSKGAVNFNIEN